MAVPRLGVMVVRVTAASAAVVPVARRLVDVQVDRPAVAARSREASLVAVGPLLVGVRVVRLAAGRSLVGVQVARRAVGSRAAS